ncbi:MAG: alanine racemase, partial [Pseudomonadota bacterium]
LEVEGVLSHLSTASGDTPEDRDFASSQLERFDKCLREIKILGFSPPLRHIANSAATVDLLSSSCNMVRPGLILYGVYPSSRFAEKIQLKPVMSLKTEIIQIKRVPAAYGISYGRTFVTRRESVIATLPIGYADGYNRLLSNRGAVLIRGSKVPVVGTMCMDMLMVDVTEVPNVRVGDQAVLMGRQGDNEISADDVAREIGTISYEVFCGVSKRVPRIYIRDGKIVGKKIDV